MDDQARGTGPGQEGGHGPEPVPVVVRPRPVLEVLAEEAISRGVSYVVCRRVLDAGFDPELLEPFMIDLVPRCSRMGLFGLATLCLELIHHTGRYHAAAQAALVAGEFTKEQILSVVLYGQRLTDERSVLWWHDVVVPLARHDSGYQTVLVAHGDLLLAHRYEAVREYLLHPDRGPGGCNVDSMTEVLQRTDRPGPFVERWAEWIRSGRFDGHGRHGDEDAAILAACLSDVLTSRPEVVTPLLDEAVRRWRWQLGNPDEAERRRGVNNLLQVVGKKPVFAGRVQAEVMHAIGPSHFPEWESLDRAFTALRYLEAVGDDRAHAAFRAAFHAALREVRETDG